MTRCCAHGHTGDAADGLGREPDGHGRGNGRCIFAHFPDIFVRPFCACLHSNLLHRLCRTLECSNIDIFSRLLCTSSMYQSPFVAAAQTAFLNAAGQGDAVKLVALLACGVDIEAKNFRGSTALIFAAAAGHLNCCRLLLEGGANREATDNDGRSVLMRASRHIDCVRLLVNSSVNIEARDKDGVTALMHAAAAGRTEFV